MRDNDSAAGFPVTLRCGPFNLDLGRPLVMGVLNVTPDSFSDGGSYTDPHGAIRRARRMIEEGADIIDVGGESTRPGAAAVSEQEEMDRILPVIEAVAGWGSVPVSVDTSKAVVMGAAADQGAALINDVRALREPGALRVAADSGLAVCLMHMQGQPRTMQASPQYRDVVSQVRDFLAERVAACVQAGIARERLMVDPGFGFGKTLRHNLLLMRHLAAFRDLGLPLLVGVSRKSMIGQLLDLPVEQRLEGSLALATIAFWHGASILRVHDVRATVRALRVCAAVRDVDFDAV